MRRLHGCTLPGACCVFGAGLRGLLFMRRGLPLFVALLLGGSSPALAASVFTTRPDDPAAIYLTAPDFGVRGDGTSDDSAAIQAAIDKAPRPATAASCSCRPAAIG